MSNTTIGITKDVLSKLTKKDDSDPQPEKEVFPEDSFTPEELIRALRVELAKEQATVDTSFRERQRQTVVNELVAERNEARDKAISTRLEVGAEIADHVFRVVDRDGLLDTKIFDAIAESFNAAISAHERMRLDEEGVENDAIKEVFTKYYKKLHPELNTSDDASIVEEATSTSPKELPAVTGQSESTDNLDSASWEDFIKGLGPKEDKFSF